MFFINKLKVTNDIIESYKAKNVLQREYMPFPEIPFFSDCHNMLLNYHNNSVLSYQLL